MSNYDDLKLWGCEQGFDTFHLGGGVGSGEDPLYKFKAAFNRNSDYRFAIGKGIINREVYDELLRIRGLSDEEVEAISYFPQYRGEYIAPAGRNQETLE